MKRDLDLVRAIMVVIGNHEKERMKQVEVSRDLHEQFPEISLAGDRLVGHVRMMGEAGLVEANIQPTMQADFFSQIRLTWEGQEFLANAQDERVWGIVKEKYGEVSFALLKVAVVETAKKIFGL